MKRTAKMLVLMMILTMLLGLTAQASSPQTSTSSSSSSNSQATAYADGVSATADGVEVHVTAVSEGTKNAAAQKARELVSSTATVLKIFEMWVPGGLNGATNITMKVPGVVSGQKIAVMHYTNNNWELVPVVSVGNGTVTATFTSLSPVAIVAYNASAKTADGNIAWMCVLAGICLAGALICSKKARQF